MTSVQAEYSSTRLSTELNSNSHSSNSEFGASSPTPLPDLLARLGGRFTVDIADILDKIPEKQAQQKLPETQSKPINNEVYQHQAFALARLRGKNISGAIDYIQRHALDQMNWLENQIKHFYPRFRLRQTFSNPFLQDVQSTQQSVELIPDGILVDAEAGRIVRLIGQFGVYRAWVFAHSIDDGDGWLERKQLENLWQTVGVAKGKRQARRIIQQGIEQEYWTQDKVTKRIYLFGQVKVTRKLVETALDSGYHHLIETNKPGKRGITQIKWSA